MVQCIPLSESTSASNVITINADDFKFEWPLPYKYQIKTNAMRKRGRYLIKEKQKTDEQGNSILTSPSIREWECLDVQGMYYKIQDHVEYYEVVETYGILGGGQLSMTGPRGPFWIHLNELDEHYDVMEEI